MTSVLRPWVMELSLREQGTLLTAIRGCDLTPKYPLDAPERRLVAAIRYAVLVPADEREVDAEPGTFMSRHIPLDVKPSAFGHYPLHWVMHLVHTIEVLAYRHPTGRDDQRRGQWLQLYYKFVKSFHLAPECKPDFMVRMAEDRIASGEIVS
jgi:hypothetical protein